MDSSSSSIVRAPIKRIFISNSSFNTIMRSSMNEGLTLYRSLNTLLTISAHRIKERPPNSHTLGTKTNSLNDIGSSSNSSINIHLYFLFPSFLLQGIHYLNKDLDPGPCIIQLSTTMI